MKTITLDTAKSLKAAFDAAGISMPTAELYYRRNEGSNIWGKMPYTFTVKGLEQIPAPNAEELGKWLPNYFLRMPLSMSRFEDGTYFYRYSAVNNGSWNQVPKITKGHEWQCEAWAHLTIACLKADLEQIKKHLENLKWIQLFHF